MKYLWLLSAGYLLLATGCADVLTRPMHSPLYPDQDEAVTLSVDAESDSGIKEIILYETVNTINSSGAISSAGTETELDRWTIAGSPNTHLQSFTKPSGYGSNKLVTYRFSVKNGSNKTRNHSVSFVTRPYPVPNQPAPVFAQGDVDDVFDIVFIPDLDINDMDDFRDRCGELITNTIHREPMMLVFSRQFNFYINPIQGDAVDYNTGDPHILPSNNANLTFAEGRALLHRTVQRDFAQGGVFSMEWDRPQTLLHEAGHSLFRLADEYGNGVHWEESTLPNNYDVLSDAQAAAPSRGKTSADAVEMGTSGWYRLCDNTCPMVSGSAMLFDYDQPCTNRLIFLIFDNIAN
jgi:hypothetical protein